MNDDRLPERVKTPRLNLRRWRHDEAEILGTAVAANLDHLRPWMPWVKFEPLTHVERITLIEGWTRNWEDGGDVVLGVFLDGEVIGSTGFHLRAGPRALEIGYWVDVDHTRCGYATEITAAMTSAAFELPGIDAVQVHIDEANEASAGVPSKLGFQRHRVDTRDKEAPGEIGRLVIWRVTRDSWAERNGVTIT